MPQYSIQFTFYGIYNIHIQGVPIFYRVHRLRYMQYTYTGCLNMIYSLQFSVYRIYIQLRTRGESSCPLWEFQAGHCPPPGKYKIKRKLSLKSNTLQWQRLRICLKSLLIQGEKSFSLLKRILHYTRCTMTESRLNDLALIAYKAVWALYWKMFVQENPRKL